MPSSVSLGYCPWLAGSTWSDSIGRADVAATSYLGVTRGGVLITGNGDLFVAPGSGMAVTINAGAVVIPNSSGSGAYRVWNPTQQTLTVTTAPSSPNSRIDLICATVVDNGNSTSFGEIQIIAGTPSTSPVAPSLPTNSISLATLFVGSSVTSFTSANFTDTRITTAAPGGVVVCQNMSSLPVGDTGVIGYDTVNNRFFMLTAAGAKPFRVMGFPVTRQLITTNQTFTGATGGTLTYNTIASVNITVDGNTDIEVHTHWPGFYIAGNINTQIGLQIYMDSTLVDEIDLAIGTFSSVYKDRGGHSIWHSGADASTTPSAGTHTIYWKVFGNQQSVATNFNMNANSGNSAYLRVQPQVS